MSHENDQGPTVRLPHLVADEVEEKTAKEVKADKVAAAKEESKPTASTPTQHSNK